jgi:hypothetical protein
MPTVPLGGANLGAYSPSPAASPNQAPGLGTVLAAAAVQAQDPARSMPKGADRPRLPARPLRRKLQAPLKTRSK